MSRMTKADLAAIVSGVLHCHPHTRSARLPRGQHSAADSYRVKCSALSFRLDSGQYRRGVSLFSTSAAARDLDLRGRSIR